MNRPDDPDHNASGASVSTVPARTELRDTVRDDRADPMPRNDIPERAPSEEGVPHSTAQGTYRYTMAEAARLKGVSYHTVSRAVRRGRLPVQRLGRMALIAVDDLELWTPMRERAPRKYQSRQPALDASPVLLDVAAGERSDLAERLAALYEEIHVAARDRPLDEVAVLIRDSFATAFKLDRVVIWIFDDELQTARRLTRTASLRTRFPEQVQLADFPFFRNMRPTNTARLISDLSAADPNIGAYFSAGERPGTVLYAPLKVGGQLKGMIGGDRAGRMFDLTAAELALAQGFATQSAIALENMDLRAAAYRRSAFLEAIIEDLPESVIAVDAAGTVILSNRAHREITGDDGRSRAPERAGAPGGAPRGPRSRPDLTRALAGEDVPRFDYSVEQVGKADQTLTVTTKPIRIGNDVAGAFSVARDVTVARETMQRRQDHVAEVEAAAGRAQAVVDVVTQVNAKKTVQDVASIAIARLVQELGGDSGIVKLRDAHNQFELRATYNLDIPPDLTPRFSPISNPNTILAFARQTSIFINVEEAGTSERETMELLSWGGMLIVPFQLNDDYLGFAFVGYESPFPSESIDMTFAATLGLQCAHALEKVSLIADLEAVHSRLLTVIDQLPQAVVIVNPEGIVTTANKVAEELWGFSLADGSVRAAQLPVLDPQGMLYDRDLHPLMRSGRTGRSYLGEPMTIERETGETVEVLSNHAPIFSATGTITGAVSILQDRAHFKPLDRVKDEFLSVVAHELRNPLTSLKGNLQLLDRRIRRDGALTAEEGLSRVDAVLGQVDRIAELVSRLLDISRADLGRLDVSVSATDAAAIVQKASDEAAGMVPDREVRVTCASYVPVVWDEVRIEQILTNLLTNAARYAPDGPIEIDLRESRDGPDHNHDLVQISVRDHGAGIPAGIRPRLFKQYYRFDDGHTDIDPASGGRHGLGIGLYLSERFAHAHGGTLEVDDARDGGAIFTLSLPRVAKVPDVIPTP